jgi:hypothetical protein
VPFIVLCLSDNMYVYRDVQNGRKRQNFGYFKKKLRLLRTNQQGNAMGQKPSWETDNCSAGYKILVILCSPCVHYRVQSVIQSTYSHKHFMDVCSYILLLSTSRSPKLPFYNKIVYAFITSTSPLCPHGVVLKFCRNFPFLSHIYYNPHACYISHPSSLIRSS